MQQLCCTQVFILYKVKHLVFKGYFKKGVFLFILMYCILHLEWNHNIDSVSNFLDERLAEISGEPNFRAFCETKWKKIKKARGEEKVWLYEEY